MRFELRTINGEARQTSASKPRGQCFVESGLLFRVRETFAAILK